MNKYPKIQTVYKRDPETNYKTLLIEQWSEPEFDYLKDCLWDFTEKVDGTNIRVIWDGECVVFKGKSDNSQIPPFLLRELQRMFRFTDNFKKAFDYDPDEDDIEVCLYGEGYGARIQKGGGNYIKDGVSFVLFDIKVGKIWLKREGILDIAEKLDILVVPRIGIGTLHTMVDMAHIGFNSYWGEFLAEGIVAKPQVDFLNRRGHRIITKIKHKDFKEEVVNKGYNV